MSQNYIITFGQNSNFWAFLDCPKKKQKKHFCPKFSLQIVRESLKSQNSIITFGQNSNFWAFQDAPKSLLSKHFLFGSPKRVIELYHSFWAEQQFSGISRVPKKIPLLPENFHQGASNALIVKFCNGPKKKMFYPWKKHVL